MTVRRCGQVAILVFVVFALVGFLGNERASAGTEGVFDVGLRYLSPGMEPIASGFQYTNEESRNRLVASLSVTDTTCSPTTGEIVSFQGTGKQMHFNATYQDTCGVEEIAQVKLAITRGSPGDSDVKPADVQASSLPAAEAILTYDVATNQIKLEEFIEGKKWPPYAPCVAGLCTVGTCTPGQAGYAIVGRLLILDCSKTTVTGAEDTLKVQWLVKAKGKFSGEKDLWLWVKDLDGVIDGFNLAGSWTSN